MLQAAVHPRNEDKSLTVTTHVATAQAPTCGPKYILTTSGDRKQKDSNRVEKFKMIFVRKDLERVLI